MVIKKTTQSTEKQICAQCDKSKNLLDYYMTKDEFFFPTGRIPVCKVCLFKRWEDEGYDAFLDTMRIINKPVDDEHFKKVEENFRSYIKDANSLLQFKDKTFLDTTLFENTKSTILHKSIKPIELTPEELKEAEEYWGMGKTEEEYIWLTREFSGYGFNPDKQSVSLEHILAEICLTRLDIRNRRNQNKDVDKQLTTLNALMTAGGVKPTQEGGTGNAEIDAYSLWIKKLENERPISDPKPEWADVDGIRKMIITYFLHPWARLFNKEKESPYYKEAKEELDKYTVKPHDYSEDD